jgi:Fic family protein
MEKYNWQQDDWPEFKFSLETVDSQLFQLAEMMGHVSGYWEALPEGMQQEAIIHMMVAEAVKTSEIEGEFISRKDVLSSIRRNLGLHLRTDVVKDKRAAGVAELMVDVRKTFEEPLSEDMLFRWHSMLLGDKYGLQIGRWRTHIEAMQIVSGALGKEKVHFEAPPSSRVAEEMNRFIAWFNAYNTSDIKQGAVLAAVSHVYFESMHPFEDGNGRIGRAIAEKALSRGAGRPVLLSLSKTIEANRKEYYDALMQAQRTNQITEWIEYFIHTLLKAQEEARFMLDFSVQKTRFFDRLGAQLNARQQKVLNRMLEEGPDGFEGGINATKYRHITKISKATATRDLQYLTAIGALKKIGDAGGRSTRYEVNL